MPAATRNRNAQPVQEPRDEGEVENEELGVALGLGGAGLLTLLRDTVTAAVSESVSAETAHLSSQLGDALRRLDNIEGAAASVQVALSKSASV